MNGFWGQFYPAVIPGYFQFGYHHNEFYHPCRSSDQLTMAETAVIRNAVLTFIVATKRLYVKVRKWKLGKSLAKQRTFPLYNFHTRPRLEGQFKIRYQLNDSVLPGGQTASMERD